MLPFTCASSDCCSSRRALDLGARVIELVALLHGRGTRLRERVLLQPELFDRDLHLVEQLAVLIGGGRAVRRA